jgi:hypothetical protein
VRRANEEIHSQSDGRSQRRLIGLICECSRQGCLSPIAVPIADYETLRADHRHCLVAPGHIWDETSEQVVLRTDMYWIVRRTDSVSPNG